MIPNLLIKHQFKKILIGYLSISYETASHLTDYLLNPMNQWQIYHIYL